MSLQRAFVFRRILHLHVSECAINTGSVDLILNSWNVRRRVVADANCIPVQAGKERMRSNFTGVVECDTPILVLSLVILETAKALGRVTSQQGL
jgi:hypothetical protein